MGSGREDFKEGVVNCIKGYWEVSKMKTQRWLLNWQRRLLMTLRSAESVAWRGRRLAGVGWAKNRSWGREAGTVDNSFRKLHCERAKECDVPGGRYHCSWNWSRREGETDHVGKRDVNCRKDERMVSRALTEKLAFNGVGVHTESLAQYLVQIINAQWVLAMVITSVWVEYQGEQLLAGPTHCLEVRPWTIASTTDTARPKKNMMKRRSGPFFSPTALLGQGGPCMRGIDMCLKNEKILVTDEQLIWLSFNWVCHFLFHWIVFAY